MAAAAAAAALAAADPPPAMPQAAGAGGPTTRRDFYWLRSFLAGEEEKVTSNRTWQSDKYLQVSVSIKMFQKKRRLLQTEPGSWINTFKCLSS
ncbi:SLC25A16 isoform 7 [Pongo abelii]|uniref:SLC25A16 isoform 7 n=1 Tax=Pongo abelii TaxID=9601 RepID=A0A2J8WRA9_PONAB|nr:SLC25A16 isoform 7 [Pongo abelii]